MSEKPVGVGVHDAPHTDAKKPAGEEARIAPQTKPATDVKRKKEPGRGIAVKIFYPILFWIFWVVMALYHWPTYRGRKNLPEGPCVLCGNHSGFADPIWVFLAMRTRVPPWTMAKKSVMEKPLLGRWLAAFRAFPVDRDSVDIGAIKKSLSVLKQGEKLLIFPEGTRIKKGKKSEPKSGAVMLAQRAGVPIVPVYITPNRKPFQPIKIIIGEPYEPAFASRRPTPEELEQRTAEMMEKIYGMGKRGTL